MEAEKEWEEAGGQGWDRVMGSRGGGDSRLKVTSERRQFGRGQCVRRRARRTGVGANETTVHSQKQNFSCV